jgi:NitT/TauT family transport system permease protein
LTAEEAPPIQSEDARPGNPLRARARGLPGWLAVLAGALVLAALWPLVTRLLGTELFPGPVATFAFLGREGAVSELWRHVSITLLRVLSTFGLALLLGIPAGYVLGVSPAASNFFVSWLGLLLMVPRILLLLVAFLIVGLNEQALTLAITVILFPTAVVQVREGVRALDPRLSELAQVFRLSPAKRALNIVLPQLAPVLLGTARVTLSLAWKMVVFAEVFGRTSGVGYMISFYFQGFEMRGILAYGLVMTVILASLDALLGMLGARSQRWQGAGR